MKRFSKSLAVSAVLAVLSATAVAAPKYQIHVPAPSLKVKAGGEQTPPGGNGGSGGGGGENTTPETLPDWSWKTKTSTLWTLSLNNGTRYESSYWSDLNGTEGPLYPSTTDGEVGFDWLVQHDGVGTLMYDYVSIGGNPVEISVTVRNSDGSQTVLKELFTYLVP